MAVPSISQIETYSQSWTGETLAPLAKGLNCEPCDLLARNPLDKDEPWVWRAEQIGTNAPKGKCVITGNVSKGRNVYFMPFHTLYDNSEDRLRNRRRVVLHGK